VVVRPVVVDVGREESPQNSLQSKSQEHEPPDAWLPGDGKLCGRGPLTCSG